MDATQQHLLDLYRAAQHQDPAPPAPGTGERALAREVRTWWDFRAVVDRRAAERRARRRTLLAFLRPGARTAARTAAAPMTPAAPAAPAPRPQASQRTAAPLSTCSTPPMRRA
ncbi:hypothetical protein AF335_10775 [Streptomyces eurocidicus]|uniref:Uncharacterized protein n=1 Tax=Streptomyces eurocidicus TaxID=66423 RepID=A0A2N8NX80_STREU|nr:hypothetical protein [Streptomyces eurocidicus]MBB5120403.1 hypothetical protein [Streptomyces eurocidicus]MBF6054082.1 hypothetical protein [Streptomyces eurocidicus]PNE33377.1 hypothetical protein AF335_10775 [Streptomyces eurocidicus]